MGFGEGLFLPTVSDSLNGTRFLYFTVSLDEALWLLLELNPLTRVS